MVHMIGNEELPLLEDEPLRVNDWAYPALWMFAIGMGCVGLVLLALYRPHDSSHIWIWRGLGLAFLIEAAWLARGAMSGIWLQSEGITLKRTFRTYDLSWSEIQSFHLRRAIYRPCLVVRLVGGREIGALGFASRTPRERERAEHIVAVLNERREAGSR